MEPDSVAVEWVLGAGAVIAAVALGFVWSLIAGPARWAARGLALTCSVTLAAAVGLAWANRLADVYPTWESLLGTSTTVNLAGGGSGTGGGADGVTASRSKGRMISFVAAGTHSTMKLPMYVYLPPGYNANDPSTRYPVIEAFHGYPGSPIGWLRALNVQKILDGEIDSGRMSPTVVLFPYQTPKPTLDTECTNIVGGPQSETYLTQDIPVIAEARLHIRTDPGAWGMIGYSAGGYCASDLLLRHPTQYAAAASLSGYATPGIKIGDGSEKTTYDDLWRLNHLPVPAVSLYLTCARSDPQAMANTAMLAHAARKPMSLTTAYINGGGHNGQTWQAMEAPALDWLSSRLAKPMTTTANGGPVTQVGTQTPGKRSTLAEGAVTANAARVAAAKGASAKPATKSTKKKK